MSERICCGPCNNGYRRARDAHAKAMDEWIAAEDAHEQWCKQAVQGQAEGPEPERSEQPAEPTIEPWFGDPIWCPKCSGSIRRLLADLDDLMSLRLLHADGYQTPGDPLGEKTRKTKGDTTASPSPAQDELDELVEWLNEWEQALRDTQRGWGTVPYRGVAAPALTSAIGWLLPRLDTMLAHPELGEDFGRGVLMQHSRLQALTRTRPPMRHKPLPCPRCHRRSLFLHDDETIRCHGNDDQCGKIMSAKEYAELEAEADGSVIHSKAS